MSEIAYQLKYHAQACPTGQPRYQRRTINQPLSSKAPPCGRQEANLTALQALLGDLVHPMLLARSGTEALEYLLLGEDFALILMDAMMPGMDKFETAELIRERARS